MIVFAGGTSVIMLGSSGSVVIVMISGTMIVFAGGTSVSSFNLKVLGSSVVVVVVSGGTVVVTIASGKTVLVMGGNCVSNFEPKGSARLVSLSDNFRFTMSSKGVERSSITSPDNSQIINPLRFLLSAYSVFRQIDRSSSYETRPPLSVKTA